MENEKPNYRLRASDFVPVLGYLGYRKRNGFQNNHLKNYEPREEAERNALLDLYNILIIGGAVIAGLEALIK